MSSVIITRHGQYLNESYQWGVIPHRFPTWQAGDVLELMLGTPQKPTGYAVVSGKSIDLDKVKIEAI